jgi:hypothetical protein
MLRCTSVALLRNIINGQRIKYVQNSFLYLRKCMAEVQLFCALIYFYKGNLMASMQPETT